MSAFLTKHPCEGCDHHRTSTLTGAGYCAYTLYGDCDCDDAERAAELDEIAGQVVPLIAAMHDADMREAVARSFAEGCVEAFKVRHLDAVFDEAAFLSECGVTA